MTNGMVKWFNTNKGYGFIQPDNGNKDVFVHISAVEKSGLKTLLENQKVSFEINQDKGRSSAANIKVIGWWQSNFIKILLLHTKQTVELSPDVLGVGKITEW